MATFVETPSGTWKAVIRKRGWPAAIKTFRTKRMAQDWARSIEDEMARGVYINRSRSEQMTVKRALKRYVVEVSPTKAPETLRKEQSRARILTDALGKYSLAALRPETIADYRDERLNTVKADTIRLELALLSNMFTVAMREWGIGLPSNPVLAVRKPHGKRRERRVTEDEALRLLAELRRHSNPMLIWITRLALLTSMRQGEILGMRRRDVDLARRTVLLPRTKNEDARTVPLSRAATEIMREALANSVRPIDTDLVFFGEPGRDGQRHPYTFQKIFGDAVKRAGLVDFRFHDLRHEAISRFVEAGLSDQKVMSISGHKSAQMLKRYTHLRSANLVEDLDAAFGNDTSI